MQLRALRRSAFGLLSGLLVLASVLQPVSRAYAAGTLDQSQTAPQDIIGLFNPTIITSAGQTFTAGVTGLLDQVDLPLGLLPGGTGTLSVEIRDVVAGGTPGNTVLASTTLPVASLPAFFTIGPVLPQIPFTSFPLNPPAPVVAGTPYAIRVIAPDGVVWGATIGDVYPPGDVFSEIFPGVYFLGAGFFDLGFRTFVTSGGLSVGNAQVTEGASSTTNLNFPVTLPFKLLVPVTVPYTLANGTATGGPTCAPGVDYINTAGSVTIPAGSTSATIAVPVCSDDVVEGNETLTVTLGTPSNGVQVGTRQATGTIVDAGQLAAPVSNPNNSDKEDEKETKNKETEEQRRHRERTNQSGRSDVSLEGNVVAVEKAADGKSQLVTIGLTRGETQIVQVPCFKDGNCHDIRVGDYLEADGYQNGVGDPNTYFVATEDVDVTRNGKRVK